MPRERYKSMDASKIVEEDEEDFMKAPCQDCSWMRQFHRKSDVFGPSVKCDSVKPRTVLESGKMYLEAAENRKDFFVSSEPMKDVLIVWNSSPSSADNLVESCELSGPDSDTLGDKERDLRADEVQSIEPEI
ncbi:hypothetical protein OROHE_005479 [Orobanche hederae]